MTGTFCETETDMWGPYSPEWLSVWSMLVVLIPTVLAFQMRLLVLATLLIGLCASSAAMHFLCPMLLPCYSNTDEEQCPFGDLDVPLARGLAQTLALFDTAFTILVPTVGLGTYLNVKFVFCDVYGQRVFGTRLGISLAVLSIAVYFGVNYNPLNWSGLFLSVLIMWSIMLTSCFASSHDATCNCGYELWTNLKLWTTILSAVLFAGALVFKTVPETFVGCTGENAWFHAIWHVLIGLSIYAFIFESPHLKPSDTSSIQLLRCNA
jgi:hypothetical protein